MKILCALFTALLCLEFGVAASGDSLLEALYTLITISEQAKKSANQRLSDQYSQVAADMDRELHVNTVPSLQETYGSIQSSVYNLEAQTFSVGYNYTTCVLYVDNILANVPSISTATNVTAKAIEEKSHVYDKILYDTYLIGKSNLDFILDEVSSITEEYSMCLKSVNPEYCSTTLYDKVIEKQEKIPQLYEKETETAIITLTEKGLSYKNRVQDYSEEIIKNSKPYLSLLESCIQRLISTGKVTEN